MITSFLNSEIKVKGRSSMISPLIRTNREPLLLSTHIEMAIYRRSQSPGSFGRLPLSRLLIWVTGPQSPVHLGDWPSVARHLGDWPPH